LVNVTKYPLIFGSSNKLYEGPANTKTHMLRLWEN